MGKAAPAAAALLISLVWVTQATQPAEAPTSQKREIVLTSGELIEISPRSSCPVEGNLQGAFGRATMPTYLQCIVPMVDQWIDASYVNMPHPYGYFFVPAGSSGVAGCPYYDNTLGYCPSDNSVYLGADAVWQQYRDFGDATAPLVLAHELTHHFQTVRGIFRESRQDVILTENQADCGAGAFMAYARNQGWMSLDDVNDLAAALIYAGDAEGPDREHGTIDERLRSFDIGYLSRSPNPLTACNSFFPGIPLIVVY